MADDGEEEGSIGDTLRHWLREESDHQWLSMSVFIALVIAMAFFFDHASTLPGWITNEVKDQGTLLDIAWNDEGTEALAVFASGGSTHLSTWKQSEGWSSIASSAQPHSVDWTGMQHWLVGTDDGVEVFTGNANASSLMAMNWDDGSSAPHRVIDISSDSGVSGFLITQSTAGSALHYFDGMMVSNGTTAPMTGGDIQLKRVEMTDSSRAIVLGSSFGAGLNPTSDLTIGIVLEAWTAGSGEPSMQAIHARAGAELTAIIALQDDVWGVGNIAVAIGPTDCLLIDSTGVVEEICPGGGSAAALDSRGNLWVASKTSSLKVTKISYESNGFEVVDKSLPGKHPIDARTASAVGDRVEFYGTSEAGGEMRADLDPSASESVLRSADMLGQLLVVLTAITVFGAMGWQFYENWGKGAW